MVGDSDRPDDADDKEGGSESEEDLEQLIVANMGD